MTNKKQRGQFFTSNEKVQQVMLDLVKNKSGAALEPSAGAGHLVVALETLPSLSSITALELDTAIPAVCSTPMEYGDFFTFANGKENRYDVIFGNPPYVAWKHIEEATQLSAAAIKKDYSDKTNLYYLFIDRCVDLLKDNGEIVFIVPKEWLYTSSAKPLREKISRLGHISHIVDCGEEKLFADADVPALLIFRFVKSKEDEATLFATNLNEAHKGNWETREFISKDGRWMLLEPELAEKVATWGKFGDQYSVKVGIVSGLDGVFRITNPEDFEPETIQSYITTKGIELFIDVNSYITFDSIPEKTRAYLLEHKPALIGRKIAKFDESNWWRYGAIRNKNAMDSSAARFYSHGRTRNAAPFFTVEKEKAIYFGGGIIGIFEKPNAQIHHTDTIKFLNSVEFRKILDGMFITIGNKVSFQPATLEDVPFPLTLEAL
jgi:adenine-specific DNA-methyltransferase